MSTETGRQAEKAAAAFLENKGFAVVARNWRTRWCEIDIVAHTQRRVHFVEVKYRQSAHWGNGLEYITPKKLRQMHFAAEIWVSKHQWQGDYVLSAIEVSTSAMLITEWLESL